MKQVTLLLTALWFTNFTFGAETIDPLPPLEVSEFKARAAIETLPLFVEALERGFPLLYQDQKKGQDAPKPKPAEDSNDFQKIIGNVAKAQADLNESLKNNLAEIKKRREARVADKTPLPEKAPEAKAEEAPKAQLVEAWSDKSFLNFCDCAKRSITVLRAKRRSELSADKTIPLQLESLLSAERGNGKTVGSEGLACGKFLGPLGFGVGDKNLELLFLTSLTKPSSVERFASLWSTFRIWSWVQQNGDKVKAPSFWDYVIQRNLMRHLFAREALPSLEQHMKEFVAIYAKPVPAEKGKLTFSTSEKSVREAIDADLKIAAALNHEANPCEKE